MEIKACGLFGVGALLAAYVGRVTGISDEFKANISAVKKLVIIFLIISGIAMILKSVYI